MERDFLSVLLPLLPLSPTFVSQIATPPPLSPFISSCHISEIKRGRAELTNYRSVSPWSKDDTRPLGCKDREREKERGERERKKERKRERERERDPGWPLWLNNYHVCIFIFFSFSLSFFASRPLIARRTRTATWSKFRAPRKQRRGHLLFFGSLFFLHKTTNTSLPLFNLRLQGDPKKAIPRPPCPHTLSSASQKQRRMSEQTQKKCHYLDQHDEQQFDEVNLAKRW